MFLFLTVPFTLLWISFACHCSELSAGFPCLLEEGMYGAPPHSLYRELQTGRLPTLSCGVSGFAVPVSLEWKEEKLLLLCFSVCLAAGPQSGGVACPGGVLTPGTPHWKVEG